MTAEERKKLPPNERRTFHRGPHDGVVIQKIEFAMNNSVETGKSHNWTQSEYNNELRKIISEYRRELKDGNIALNSHHRDWAIRMQPTGAK